MYDSEVMCRQKVDTPCSIYRDFTVALLVIYSNISAILISINPEEIILIYKYNNASSKKPFFCYFS